MVKNVWFSGVGDFSLQIRMKKEKNKSVKPSRITYANTRCDISPERRSNESSELSKITKAKSTSAGAETPLTLWMCSAMVCTRSLVAARACTRGGTRGVCVKENEACY